MDSTPTGRTYVIGIVDASGSMTRYRRDTVDGYNGYLDDLAKDADQYQYLVTTLLFSSWNYMNYLAVDLPPAEAPRLDEHSYNTFGSTALLDATMKAINDFTGRIKLEPADKVLVVTTTDGEENDSRNVTNPAAIKALITSYENTGQWKFIFLSQGVDNWHRAQAMGYGSSTYVGTRTIDEDTNAAVHRTASRAARSFAGGQSVNVSGLMADELGPEAIRPNP